MRSRRLALAATVALAAAGACKKKHEEGEKKPAGEPALGASRQGGDETEAAGDRPVDDSRSLNGSLHRSHIDAVRRLRMTPISVEEVRSAIPLLPGAEPVGQPTSAMGGRQVKAVQCVSGRDPQAAAANLVAALEKAGYTSVRSKPHPRDPAVVLVSAEKPPMRVGGSVQRGDFVDCPQKDGRTKVSLSFFKRLAEPLPADEAAARPPPPPTEPDAPE